MALEPRDLGHIEQSFDAAVAAAYADYADKLRQTGRPLGWALLSVEMLTNGDVKRDVKRAGGQLGAVVAAASKRAVRDLLFAALERAKRDGADITPTIAVRTAERVLGRGVSLRAANQVFGVPGRTAADKSLLTADDSAELEAQIGADVVRLRARLTEIRERHQMQWRRSSARDNIVTAWRLALGEPSKKTQAMWEKI